jgi:hypothetical protein
MAKQTKLVTDPGVKRFGHHSHLPVATEEPASSAAMNVDSAPVSESYFS